VLEMATVFLQCVQSLRHHKGITMFKRLNNKSIFLKEF
jgi:hypothetical protein